MKFLFLIGLSVVSFGFNNRVFATKLNVNVQCSSFGPVYQGTLVFPTQVNEWKLEEGANEDTCYLSAINPEVVLSANNHEYKGVREKLHFYKPSQFGTLDCSAIEVKNFVEFVNFDIEASVKNKYKISGKVHAYYSSAGFDRFYFATENETCDISIAQ